MRIRVVDVLNLLGSGLTSTEILLELPDLESEDAKACIIYASRKVDRAVVAA
jgi:uncharacterized protein (DUF433 family)